MLVAWTALYSADGTLLTSLGTAPNGVHLWGFSSDGKWLLYEADSSSSNVLRALPLVPGGAPVDLASSTYSARFTPSDNRVLYQSGNQLYVTTVAGGAPTPIAASGAFGSSEVLITTDGARALYIGLSDSALYSAATDGSGAVKLNANIRGTAFGLLPDGLRVWSIDGGGRLRLSLADGSAWVDVMDGATPPVLGVDAQSLVVARLPPAAPYSASGGLYRVPTTF
jgi:hypothetical protein